MGFAWRLALRESRSSLRRLGLYMGSIVLGVAALVALHGLRSDVVRSIELQSRELLGADLRLAADEPLPEAAVALIDSLESTGAVSADVTAVVSMVYDPAGGRSRLAQVQAVEAGFPFYGRPRSRPEGAWARLQEGGGVLLDAPLQTQLGVEPGDTVRIGEAAFEVRGTVEDLPTDVGFQAATGPRAFIAGRDLGGTGLLVFGSLARFRTYLRLPESADADRLEERYEDPLREVRVGYTSSREQAENLTEATDQLSRFLGLVGLAALLLGGVGVGSAVHVYVRDKLTIAAVLRCLGATGATVFRAYLLQAVGLAFLGSLAGVAVGLAMQFAMPALLQGVIPVEVQPRVHLAGPALGVAMGVWVSVVFTVLPLLEIRSVSPIRALRHGFESDPGALRTSRTISMALIGSSVVALALIQAPGVQEGLAFAAGLVGVVLLLYGAARLLMALTRRFFPREATYPVRQGALNLFRPQNQTATVILALGFGVFVVGTVLILEASLGDALRIEDGGANVLLFDVQDDQRSGVEGLMADFGASEPTVDALVPARIEAINGRAAAILLEDSTGAGPERWALRREYRNTVRADLKATEALVAGAWWPEAPTSEVARISVEDAVAADLGVGLGDRITWSLGGRTVESEVTSLRSVDWARFDTNFFVVFEPGSLRGAPRTWIVLGRVDDPEARARFQSELVGRFPNVSVLDLSRVRELIQSVLGQAARAIRFLAAFASLAGVVVMVGSLASSRFQRMRETALLATLGARRRQIRTVLLSEYVALGILSAVAGLILATATSGLLMRFVFDAPLLVPPGRLGLLLAGVIGLALGVGVTSGRGAASRPPLEVLRAVERA